MKSPKGFAKKYFTFSAILAYTVQNKLQSHVSSIYSLLHNKITKEDEKLNENDPPCDILKTLCVLNVKPCHCNCFYKLKTKITLLWNVYIPRCPYYTTYFAFRRTGTHPPIPHI
ncbi:MAG: hypothetical protein L3J19_10010 [Sulfurimonas sp.]|nr:hypothetical protein [Sulfurimonas sp.]